jgi:hypothetical protein
MIVNDTSASLTNQPTNQPTKQPTNAGREQGTLDDAWD